MQKVRELMASFPQIQFEHIPRGENDHADALANLAAALAIFG